MKINNMFRPIKMPLKPFEKLAFISVLWSLFILTMIVGANTYERTFFLNAKTCSLDGLREGDNVIFNGNLEKIDDITIYDSIKVMNIDLK